MARRLSIPDLETIEADVLGEIYTVVPVTKSVQAKADKLDDEQAAINGWDDLIKHYGKGLDLRLAQTRDGQPKPSKVIADAYKADRVTMPQVEALLNSIVETDRPT